MTIQAWIAKHEVTIEWISEFLFSKQELLLAAKFDNLEQQVVAKLQLLERETPPSPILIKLKKRWIQKRSKERLGKDQTTFTATKAVKQKLQRLSKELKTRSQSETVVTLINDAYEVLVLQDNTEREKRAAKRAEKEAAKAIANIRAPGIHVAASEGQASRIRDLVEQLEIAHKSNEELLSENIRLRANVTTSGNESEPDQSLDEPLAPSAQSDDLVTCLNEPKKEKITLSRKAPSLTQPQVKKFSI